MCLCVNHRKTDTVIRKHTGITHFLFLCQAIGDRKWEEPLLCFFCSDEKKRMLSQLPPTYTKDLGGWDGSRLLPLWKPITTNPIMSLECSVDAVNGLWCHFSKLPSYGSFTMDDGQLLFQWKKKETPLLEYNNVCVHACVCMSGCVYMYMENG